MLDWLGDGVGETCSDADLIRWARALGLEIDHSPGCPGIVVPGIGLLIDSGLPGPMRRRRIAELLRAAAREQGF